jgi:hypothetical protein
MISNMMLSSRNKKKWKKKKMLRKREIKINKHMNEIANMKFYSVGIL